jgi:hypothetical protein
MNCHDIEEWNGTANLKNITLETNYCTATTLRWKLDKKGVVDHFW